MFLARYVTTGLGKRIVVHPTSYHAWTLVILRAACWVTFAFRVESAGTTRLATHINMVAQTRLIKMNLVLTSVVGTPVSSAARFPSDEVDLSAAKSPWTALEYCRGWSNISNTWVCQSPEVCDCDWNPTTDLLALPYQACGVMGSLARVAVYAPETMAPYASLPSSFSGATGYFSPTVVSGAVSWGTALTDCKTPAVRHRIASTSLY